MSAAHTPTPWRLETVRTSCGICHKVGPFPGKVGKAGITHACIYDDYPPNTHSVELEANARFIVHAVNCHDELAAALTLARTFMVDFEGLPETEADNPLRVVDAALAKTREIGK